METYPSSNIAFNVMSQKEHREAELYLPRRITPEGGDLSYGRPKASTFANTTTSSAS